MRDGEYHREFRIKNWRVGSQCEGDLGGGSESGRGEGSGEGGGESDDGAGVGDEGGGVGGEGGEDDGGEGGGLAQTAPRVVIAGAAGVVLAACLG